MSDPQASPNDELNPTPGMGSFTARLKNSVFMLLYLMAKDANVSRLNAYVIAVVNALQLVAFSFKSEHFRWHPGLTNVAKPVLEAVGFEFIVWSGKEAVSIAFILTVGFVGLNALVCTWIGYQFWSMGTVHHLWVLPFLQTSMRLLTTILYVPVLTILFGFFDCHTAMGEWIPCQQDSDARTIASVVAGVVLVLFVFFNMLVSLVLVDDNPESSNAMAQVHGRVDCASLFLRALLSFLFAVVPSHKTSVLVAVVLVSGVLLTALYYFYLPFLRSEINCLLVSSTGLFLWSGISLLVGELIGKDSDFGATSLFLLGGPVFVVLLALAVKVREQTLAKEVLHPRMSPYLAELVLRFRLRPREENWVKVKGEYRDTVEGMFPKSPFLSLHLANLFDRCGRNNLLSAQYIRRVSGMSERQLDHSFLVFQFLKRHQEKSSGTSGALSYVAYTHHRQKAENSILESLRLVNTMWNMLASGNHSAEDLFQTASKVHECTLAAQTNLDQLLVISKNAPRALLLYAVFAQEVLNDKSKARRLRHSAKVHQNMNSDTVEELNDQQVFLVTISGNEQKLGLILDSTDNISNLLMKPKAEIIGKSLQSLCAPPFTAILNSILAQQIEAGDFEKAQALSYLWILQPNGAVCPCRVTIAPSQDKDGNLELGVKLVKLKGPMADCFVGTDMAGQVYFFSSGMMREFGLRQNAGTGMNVFKLLPALHAFGSLETLFDNDGGREEREKVVQLTFEETEQYCVTAKPKQLLDNHRLVLFTFQREENTYSDDDSVDGNLASPSSPQSPNDPMRRITSFYGTATTLPIDEGDQESRASAGSRGVDDDSMSFASTASTRAAHSLQNVIEKRIAREELRLKRFRRQCYFLALAFLTICITSQVYQQNKYQRLYDTVHVLSKSAERAYLMVESNIAVLHHLNEIVPNSPEADYFRQVVPEMTRRDSIRLRELHLEIMSHWSTQALEQDNLLNNPTSTLTMGETGRWEPTSLSFAIKRFVSTLDAFLEEDPTVCGPSCQYILNNGQWEVVDVAMESSRLYFEYCLDLLKSVVVFNKTILIITSLLIVATILFQLLPVLIEIRRTKNSMSSSLKKLPAPLLKQLRRTSHSKVILVKQQMEDIHKTGETNSKATTSKQLYFEASNDVDGNEEGEEGWGITSSSGKKNGTTLPASPVSKKKKKTAVAPVSSNSDQKEQKTATRRMKRKAKVQRAMWYFLTLVRLVVPLLLIIGYFFLVMLTSQSAGTTAGYMCGQLLQIGDRWVTLQRLHYAIECPLPEEGPEWSRWARFPEQYAGAVNGPQFLQEARLQTAAILFGNESMHTRELSTIDHDSRLGEIEFTNACIDPICIQAMTEPEPDQIMFDLSFGLSLAVDRLLDRAETILASDEEIDMDVIALGSMNSLSAAIKATMEICFDNVVATTLDSKKEVIIMTVCFIPTLFLIFFTVYKIFAKINNELKYAQYCLLLIPPEVLHSVPDLKQLLE